MRAGSGESLTELVDRDPQIFLAHGVDQPVQAQHDIRDGQRHPGVTAGDHAPVSQIRAVAVPRLQIDVLLADRRTVRHHRQCVGRYARPVLDLERHRHPTGAGQPQLTDAAHGHPAVGDLRAREDATGRGELGAHGVTAVEEGIRQAGVPGTHVRHPDGGDRGKGEQLGLDRTSDHSCIPFNMSSARASDTPGGRRSASLPP